MKKSILFMVMALASTGLVQAIAVADPGGCAPPSTEYCNQDCLRDLAQYDATFSIVRGMSLCTYRVQWDPHTYRYIFVYDSHQSPHRPSSFEQLQDLRSCRLPMHLCGHCVEDHEHTVFKFDFNGDGSFTHEAARSADDTRPVAVKNHPRIDSEEAILLLYNMFGRE